MGFSRWEIVQNNEHSFVQSHKSFARKQKMIDLQKMLLYNGCVGRTAVFRSAPNF